ncbi:MAG: beta-phosphoglucomutase [Bacteroidetes bacterium]|nr:beta-phosphoglucomutase [Bacteroidota bacterium]MDA0944377.1 beta-phosphoglucomutase [Bacteroidota bacterium]MDA1112529.1 beta-phosphoglucomutase [Bacteroidota bacterium]
MIKALILDLDGVICDTAHFHYIAWKRLASEYDYELSEADNEALKGVSRVDSLIRILQWAKKEISPEQFEQDLLRKNSWYLDMVEEMGPKDLLPGVGSFVESAHKLQIPLALGSASKNAQTVLTKVGLLDAFQTIVDASQISRGKPDPETFTTAAELLGVAPNECIVFEDSLAGIQAALSGGMRAIGIGKPSDLPGAEQHINNLGEYNFADFQ